MIQGGSRCSKDIPPYVLAGREPTCYVGINLIGLRRRGFDNKTIEDIHQAYRYIYQSGLSVPSAIKQIEENLPPTPEITYILGYIDTSKRGIIPAGKLLYLHHQ